MTESGDQTENWVKTWIETQRAKLHEASNVGAAFAGAASGEPRNAPHESTDFARSMRQFAERFALPGALPPIGPWREHEQAWRDVALALAHFQELQAELHAKITAAQMAALTLLEERARQRAQAGKPLREPRELYDLWVDCGEETYAQMAHSEAYCELQARFANAAIELRARQQAVIERAAKQFGMPTRSELDSVHRQLRALRAELDRLSAAAIAKPRATRKAASAAGAIKQRKTAVARSRRSR
jgi:hypothetical protein